MDEQADKSGRKKFFTKKTIIIIALILIIGAGAGAGLVKASDNPAFCSSCHIMKSYYQSWHSSSDLLANKHAKAGVTCHQCHESSVAIQAEEGIKFVTGNYKTPLEKRNFGTREMCLKCHDFDKVKSKTNFEESNPHDSHNGEQNCNLCHSMHQQSKVMCSECHQFNWINDLDGSWKKE